MNTQFLTDLPGKKGRSFSLSALTSQIKNVKVNLELNAFYFLEYFLGLAFHLQLIPFRFGRNSDGICYIHTNIVQKILSTLMVILIALTGIFNLRFYFSKNLMETPENAFTDSHTVLLVFYPFVWFHTFWMRRDHFEGVLELTQKDGYRKKALSKPKLLWLIGLYGVIILTEGKSLWEFATGFYRQGYLQFLQFYGGFGLYSLRIRNSYEPITTEEMMNPLMAIFSGIYLLIAFLSHHLESFLELFALTAAVMVYWTSVQFIESLKALESSEFKKVADLYTHFERVIDGINTITQHSILIYIVSMIPAFVWCIFGIFEPNSTLDDTSTSLYTAMIFYVFYIHKISIASIVLIIAAKGNAKAQQLNTWIMKAKKGLLQDSSSPCESEFYDNSTKGREERNFNSFLDYMHRQMCNNPIGLRGGSFFTISYGFIGTTMSVVVTYAVVMLQFQVERYKRLKALAIGGGDFANTTGMQQQEGIPRLKFLETLLNLTGDASNSEIDM